MKTFEEKWTAWLDGELSGTELAEFEASLPDKAAAEAEKHDAHKLGAFLKEQLRDRAMGNEEFFHHQLRERIAADARTESAPEPTSARPALWPIGRLVWVGASSLAIFCVCTLFVLREKGPADQSQYLTQILNARVDPAMSPNATISMFESKQDKVTVLWVDGLQTLPSEYATK
jgi:anti-sigma factor RsiW